MGETETNFRDELTKLAEISEIFENSIFGKGKMSVIVELEKEDYREVVGFLSPRDINSKSIVINISDMEFTLVLSK
jgi:hypothetical protein